MHYVVFSGGKYYLLYTLRSIFGEWIIFVLYTRQYFREVDIVYTMNYETFSGVKYFYTKHYVVFSGGKYYLYYALRCIFEG